MDSGFGRISWSFPKVEEFVETVNNCCFFVACDTDVMNFCYKLLVLYNEINANHVI